jgi:hypothetical protein
LARTARGSSSKTTTEVTQVVVSESSVAEAGNDHSGSQMDKDHDHDADVADVYTFGFIVRVGGHSFLHVLNVAFSNTALLYLSPALHAMLRKTRIAWDYLAYKIMGIPVDASSDSPKANSAKTWREVTACVFLVIGGVCTSFGATWARDKFGIILVCLHLAAQALRQCYWSYFFDPQVWRVMEKSEAEKTEQSPKASKGEEKHVKESQQAAANTSSSHTNSSMAFAFVDNVWSMGISLVLFLVVEGMAPVYRILSKTESLPFNTQLGLGFYVLLAVPSFVIVSFLAMYIYGGFYASVMTYVNSLVVVVACYFIFADKVVPIQVGGLVFVYIGLAIYHMREPEENVEPEESHV